MAAPARLPEATIAMVNGWCFGGGVTPVVACDLTIAANEATFACPGQLGRLSGRQRNEGDAETIGCRNALYYAMTGETFDGQARRRHRPRQRSVPRKKLRRRAEVAHAPDEEPDGARGIKIAMKRVRYMDRMPRRTPLREDRRDALLRASRRPQNAMKATLDERSSRPGLEHFERDDLTRRRTARGLWGEERHTRTRRASRTAPA